MEKKQADIGLIGLGVMGQNLALNIADHGFMVVGLDRDKEKASTLSERSENGRAQGVSEINEFIEKLKTPRAILLLVPAGQPVDDVIDELKTHVVKGDIIIDGGNSHFSDTDRHAADLADRGIDFLGVGVSGGADGARYGPSMMPGGPEKAYRRVEPIFEAAAARVNGDPCVTYLGPGSAGHYVKMVHNGIEYALMQLIAEAYDMLRHIGGLTNDQIADTFGKWNQGVLNSFLIEITSDIFRVPDPETDRRLIDVIQDAARQKGTGKWTSQEAMELQAPVPTIDAAVSLRDLSTCKQEREHAARVLPRAEPSRSPGIDNLTEQLEKGLHFGFIVSYAQGMALLRRASKIHGYELQLADIARIWRGGCIIRSALLDDICKVFEKNKDAANLMLEKPFADILSKNRETVKNVLSLAFDDQIPIYATASALSYFDGYRTLRLPANLIQAQRDYFGSHTYERIDRHGTFHTDWSDRKERQ